MKYNLSIVLLFPLFTFGQNNYYVSPSGNNTNIGSLASPWKTIQYGLNQLAANDILNVLTGTYNEKIVIPRNSVTLKNHTGNTPIIDGMGIIAQNAIIDISNKSNITIDGFEIKNSIQNDAQGILVEGTGTNINIKNCKIHDIHFSSNPNAAVTASTNAQGIIVYGTNSTTAISNLKITNNQVYDCRLGYSEGIAVNGNVDGFEITNNTVYNLTNIGIDVIGHEASSPNPANDQARNGLIKNNLVHDCLSLYATSGGIYVDGGKSIAIENNTSYHNGYGIEIGCENVGKTTDAIKVRNNIIYNNQIAGVSLGGFSYPTSGKVVNSSFTNNTCYANGYSNAGYGELYLSYSENTIIENNIFYTNTQNKLAFAELTQPTLTFNYNDFYSASGNLSFNWNGVSYSSYVAFKTSTGSNVNSINVNPNFILAAITNPDFHLNNSSPCINSGNPAFVAQSGEVDVDNQARVNSIVDCGADEFYALATHNFEEKEKIRVYPNPVTNSIKIGNNFGKSTVEILSITGQTVYKKLDFEANDIDVSQLKAGVYILNVSNENGNYAVKIIKN
jgi:Secretion system C-terminal sorting domain/Right handed beta helix region